MLLLIVDIDIPVSSDSCLCVMDTDSMPPLLVPRLIKVLRRVNPEYFIDLIRESTC